MIFDDHDVHDDWNTSQAWRRQMNQRPWWRERIRAALASYWVYQHLGNLPPGELAADPDYRKVLDADGDTWPQLVELADRADAEVDGSKGVRFSFRWDLGTSRFIMIDSRNGRILDDGRHLMLGDREFGWVEEQMADGAVDHLVLGTSLPWLLPHALGDVQAVSQIAANRPGWRGRLAETIRQGADLEHWQAFHESFDWLTRLIGRAATGDPGEQPPATVSVLSGDVHHTYAARVDLPGITGNGTDRVARVHQLTCSPVHNKLHWFIKPAFRLGWSRRIARLTGRWSDRAGVTPVPVRWDKLCGPLFGNMVATLELDNRQAAVSFAQPRTAASLVELARLELAPSPDPSDPVPLRGSQTTSRPRQQTGEVGQPPSLQPPCGVPESRPKLVTRADARCPPTPASRTRVSLVACGNAGWKWRYLPRLGRRATKRSRGTAELVRRAVGVAIPLDVREPGRGDQPRHLRCGVHALYGHAVVHLVAETERELRQKPALDRIVGVDRGGLDSSDRHRLFLQCEAG
jgi:hypothetical protein